jgi:16S rRNA (cytosine1402-N4)-methyltransferase
MGQDSDLSTAADLLNTLSEQQLSVIFRDYSDERWAVRIAKFVIERRQAEPYRTAGQLVDTVYAAVPVSARPKDINPATRVFQALRIAVNQEFEALQNALEEAAQMLAPNGRIVVISYHSGEDTIAKRTFAELSGKCVCDPKQPMCSCRAKNPILKVLTRKPIMASASEIEMNPRARSAKMRVAQRIDAV